MGSEVVIRCQASSGRDPKAITRQGGRQPTRALMSERNFLFCFLFLSFFLSFSLSLFSSLLFEVILLEKKKQ